MNLRFSPKRLLGISANFLNNIFLKITVLTSLYYKRVGDVSYC